MLFMVVPNPQCYSMARGDSNFPTTYDARLGRMAGLSRVVIAIS
jgi:hypothetical protein